MAKPVELIARWAADDSLQQMGFGRGVDGKNAVFDQRCNEFASSGGEVLVNDPGLIPIGPLQKGSCVQSAILPNVCGGTALRTGLTRSVLTRVRSDTWSAPLMGGNPVITYLERTVCWERYSQ